MTLDVKTLTLAVTESEEKEDEIKFSTGVVLGFKQFPVLALMEVQNQFPDPEVPKEYIKELDRIDYNYNHPAYLAAKEQVAVDRGLAMLARMIVFGTYVKHLPEDVPDWQNDEWLEDLEFLGIDVPTNKKVRYLLWVKLRAAISPDDINNLNAHFNKQFGSGEENVQSEIEKFQNNS